MRTPSVPQFVAQEKIHTDDQSTAQQIVLLPIYTKTIGSLLVQVQLLVFTPKTFVVFSYHDKIMPMPFMNSWSQDGEETRNYELSHRRSNEVHKVIFCA